MYQEEGREEEKKTKVFGPFLYVIRDRWMDLREDGAF